VTEDERSLYAVIERLLAKDPKDRFQTAAELERSLDGQETAPSVVPPRPRTGPPIVLMPGEAPIVPQLQPTAISPVVPPPLPPPGEARTAGRTEGDGRQGPRRVANRSAVMKRNPVAWPLVLAILLLAGGAIYWFGYRRSQTASPSGTGVTADSVTKDSAAVSATGDSARPSAASPAAADTEKRAAAAPLSPSASRSATTPVRDSGAVRIRNLPAGSEVLIDDQRATSAVTILPVGPHVVAISAPRHRFYAETVSVNRHDTLLLAPVLTPLGEPVQEQPKAVASGTDPCEPGPQWDGTQCFDVRPEPLSTPFVALPQGVRRVSRPAEFWIFVGLSGASEEVRLLRSSGNQTFDKAARAIASSLEWTPAQRGGAAVSAWTQMVFPAAR
jgi:hypothetical protein